MTNAATLKLCAQVEMKKDHPLDVADLLYLDCWQEKPNHSKHDGIPTVNCSFSGRVESNSFLHLPLESNLMLTARQKGMWHYYWHTGDKIITM